LGHFIFVIPVQAEIQNGVWAVDLARSRRRRAVFDL
jgi:hypothetical protein